MKSFVAILLTLPMAVHASEETATPEEKVAEASAEPASTPAPVAATGASLRVDPSLLRRLPVNRPGSGGGADRAFEDLAELAPGVQRDMYGVSINGATSAENAYRVDGLSTRNLSLGVNASALSVEFLDEVDVILGGYLPEYGRAQGGIIQAVTRTGTNEFRGSVFAHWTPGALDGQPGSIPNSAVIQTRTSLKNLGDLGATLGGPIVKDRLWFFAGFVPSFTRYAYVRELVPISTVGDAQLQPIPGSGRGYFLDDRSLQYLAKVTFRPAENHHLSLSLSGIPSTESSRSWAISQGRDLSGGARQFQTGILGSLEMELETTAGSLTYAGEFLDRRARVEVNAGWFRQARSTQLLDSMTSGAVHAPGVADVRGASQVRGAILGATPRPAEGTTDRYQANATAAWRFDGAGSHVLKAGGDVELLQSEWERLAAFPPVSEPMLQTARSTLVGAFVQDSWSVTSRVTVNLGLRYDVQSLSREDMPVEVDVSGQFSPRVGAVVDVLGDGRTRAFAHFARYQEQVPLQLMESVGARGALSVERGLLPQSSTELMAGAEHELAGDTRLGAWYVHRNLDQAVEDMSEDDGLTYFLGNPGRGRMGSGFPEPMRTYDAGTVYLSHAFSDGWLAQASYTLSRLRGNYSGLLRPDTSMLSPNTLPDFDSPELMRNSEGLLPLDRTHAIKLFGAKEFHLSAKVSTSVGLAYRGGSGTPYNALGGHPLYGGDATFILPRGVAGRTPWVHTLDSNLGLDYRLSGSQVLSLTVAVFNLFNFQAATRVDEMYTDRYVFPVEGGTRADLPGRVQLTPEDGSGFLASSDVNGNFGKPIQLQAPRQFRLGVRYSF
ncbi:TonB-dependent receptor [Pyxidicoccus fallax]|uniref:TonB-dependent receptor n=1 Tax=Pyxidicoccus fallax TaxID=394095 RepID=A0A848LBM4_9BACT|nr:TonB-dependent receptor [Pyxidicoccus fallax]NMO15886.1 TonB-dependent receptor [Pyxidicoccus fallax]NPC84491.1 TonB-dependent receptor [Pyxidicoccus fallax]